MHRVRRSDTVIDLSTTFRHHPLEVVVALGWYGAATAGSGASPEAVVAYGWTALLLSIVEHADRAAAAAGERVLCRIAMTPGLHHVHHSAEQAQTDSNNGDVVPCWDWLFDTLRRGKPERIGLATLTTERRTTRSGN